MKHNEYKMTSMELKKSIVTPKDFNDVCKIVETHHTMLNSFLFLLKKESKIAKTSIIPLLNNVLKREQTLSEEMYNKDYKCLTRKEHMNILKILYAEYKTKENELLVYNEGSGSRKENMLRYLDGRHFHEVTKIYNSSVLFY